MAFDVGREVKVDVGVDRGVSQPETQEPKFPKRDGVVPIERERKREGASISQNHASRQTLVFQDPPLPPPRGLWDDCFRVLHVNAILLRVSRQPSFRPPRFVRRPQKNLETDLKNTQVLGNVRQAPNHLSPICWKAQFPPLSGISGSLRHFLPGAFSSPCPRRLCVVPTGVAIKSCTRDESEGRRGTAISLVDMRTSLPRVHYSTKHPKLLEKAVNISICCSPFRALSPMVDLSFLGDFVRELWTQPGSHWEEGVFLSWTT